MNIIIVGCGKIGQKLTAQLNQEGHNITVIDTKYNVVQDTINRYDSMGVVGNGATVSVLTEANIGSADLLIATTSSDELNLMTCLIAKKLGNCQTIARLRNPEYRKEVQLLKDDLGLTMIINPEQASAVEMARVLRFPTAIKIDTFAKGRVELLKFRIADGSVLDGISVADIFAKLNCDVLICGVERGDEAFIPRGNFMLRGKDVVSIIAAPENASYFFKKIGLKANPIKDVIIAGGGDTAFYLARELMKSGIKVKIIEKNEQRCVNLCHLLPNVVIINADATDNDVLIEENIEHTGAFIALTNIDEENVMLSLFVKSVTNAKVITKINRIAYDKVLSTLDLDTTIFPRNITAEYVTKFVRAKQNSLGCNIETMHSILDGKAEALEFRITEQSPISNMAVEELALKDNVLIACINRAGKIIAPRGKDVILPNDTVIVVTTSRGFKDITDILKHRKK